MAFLDRQAGSEFPYPRDDVFDAVRSAVRDMDGMELVSADKLGGRIVVEARLSWRSFGETIPIAVTEVALGRTRVSVTSTPDLVVVNGFIDPGKNQQNVERILAATSQRLRRTKPSGAARASPPPRAPGDIAERLARLKGLFDGGLITADDFAKRKAEILAEV